MYPYSPEAILGNAKTDKPVPYSIPRGLIECTETASYSFVTEGTLTRIAVPNNPAQEGVRDNRTFEGWRKCE